MANVIFNQKLRQKIQSGADRIFRLTAPNYGPEGRNTICDQEYDLPVIANSGRKILKDLNLKERDENLAASLVRDAGQKIADQYGDGSITTVLLTNGLIHSGLKLIAAGYDPMLMRRGIHQMFPLIHKILDEMTIPFDDILMERFVRSTAKNGEVGGNILRAFQQTGMDGVITVTDSQIKETEVRFWDGARYEYGLFSLAFAKNKEKKCSVLENPRVLLSNIKIQSVQEIKKILKDAERAKASLLIITYDMSDEVQMVLAANANRNALQVVVAKAPGFGDSRRRNMLALASKTGSVLIDENTGIRMEDCGLDICAPIKYAKIDAENTILQGFLMSSPELVGKMQKYTNTRLSETVDADEREKLQTTLSILNGRSAEIRVGAVIEYEMFEKKYLYENTVRAVQNAAESNLVPGAGNAFFRTGQRLRNKAELLADAEKTGALCLCDALEMPVRRLAENAGVSGGNVVQMLREEENLYRGYDVLTDQMVDLTEKGILMPRNMTEAIIQTVAETAASLWTTEAAVLIKA